jgi:hypothetical protein
VCFDTYSTNAVECITTAMSLADFIRTSTTFRVQVYNVAESATVRVQICKTVGGGGKDWRRLPSGMRIHASLFERYLLDYMASHPRNNSLHTYRNNHLKCHEILSNLQFISGHFGYTFWSRRLGTKVVIPVVHKFKYCIRMCVRPLYNCEYSEIY